MSVQSGPALARGLERFLSLSWDHEVQVRDLSFSTAGARRVNALFDAHGLQDHLELCATISADASSTRSLDVEASVRSLAEGFGVPVPHVYLVCLDDSFVGGPFFVSQRVSGESIPRRVLRVVSEHSLGARLGYQLGEVLGQIHSISLDDVPTEVESYDGLNPAEAEFIRAERRLSELAEPRPSLSFGIRWLEKRLPDPPETRSLVHGDVRNGNIIVGEDGLRALLDWEKCSRDDDPMKDLAWPTLRMWRFGQDDHEVGGFATLDDYVAGYRAAGGVFDEQRFRWWKTMRTVQWGLGLAGQAHTFIQGASTSLVMAASGRRVVEVEWDVLMLTNPTTHPDSYNKDKENS